MMEKQMFKRKQIADATGLNSETIRFYETKQLLSPQRDSNGYRIYNERDLERVIFINHAKKLGFSLAETKELLDLAPSEQQHAHDKVAIKIAELEAKIAELSAIKNALQNLSNVCCQSNGSHPHACRIFTVKEKLE